MSLPDDFGTPHIETMRDLGRWKRPIHAHACLDEFLAATTLGDGLHVIAYRGVYLELNLHRRASKSMVVFFNAALSSRTAVTRLPVFSGASALRVIDANILMVSDPCLYLNAEIRLAWYAGARNLPLQQDLGRVLRHVQEVLSIERAVLYGASGGGFAALYYARFLRNAIAVPCNPQINVLAYAHGLVSKYLKLAFGYQGNPSRFEHDDVPDKPVLKLDASLIGDTRIVYLQNALDRRHVERDFLPFLKSFGYERGGALVEAHSERLLSVYSKAWGEGHQAAPAAFVYPLLKHLTQANEWQRLAEWIPRLHEATANPFMYVMLRLDENRFVAQVSLHEEFARLPIRFRLLHNGSVIEERRNIADTICHFTTLPEGGDYVAQAIVEKHLLRTDRSWKQRLLQWLKSAETEVEMKSRIISVSKP